MSVCLRTAPAAFAARPTVVVSPLRMPAAVLIAGVAILLALVAALALRPAAITLTLDPGGSPAGVAVSDALVERGHGYVSVIGQMRNETSRTLRGSGVLVELLDSQGRVRGIETALVEADALHAHDAAPFRVYLPDDGTAASCCVRFRQIVPSPAR